MKDELFKTAGEAIGQLDGLMSFLKPLYNRLLDDCHSASSQWHELGRIGGRRDDAAAALLADVQVRLEQLAKQANRCAEQIKAVRRNPFGRREET